VSEPFGQLGAARPWVRRGLGQVREPDLGRAASRERRLSCEALVQHAAERVDVALPGRLPALDQLGREVVRRAEQLALGGEPRRVRPAREPEVGQSCGALAVEQHVRRLDVPVQHPARVKSIEPAAELRREIDGLLHRQRPEQAQPQRERAARVVRHGKELDAL
jgi:hypothetical protein